MELTKEHLDEVFKSLATKDDLKAIKTDVAALKTGMVHLATQESVDEIKTDLAEMKTTLAAHTTSLDNLLTAKKNKADEKTVSENRFDRLEHWAQLVGRKLGIKLELIKVRHLREGRTFLPSFSFCSHPGRKGGFPQAPAPTSRAVRAPVAPPEPALPASALQVARPLDPRGTHIRFGLFPR